MIWLKSQVEHTKEPTHPARRKQKVSRTLNLKTTSRMWSARGTETGLEVMVPTLGSGIDSRHRTVQVLATFSVGRKGGGSPEAAKASASSVGAGIPVGDFVFPATFCTLFHLLFSLNVFASQTVCKSSTPYSFVAFLLIALIFVPGLTWNRICREVSSLRVVTSQVK